MAWSGPALARHGGALLAALHLGLGAWSSPGPLFARYPRLAEGLEAGTLTAAQVADASPAYLVLHAALAPLAVRWLQLALGALAVWLLFEALRRGAGQVAAWTGAGLLALAQPWLVYGSVLEPDLLIGAALLAAGAALATSTRRPALLAAAVALGLAVSLRPTGLLLAGLTLAWLARGPARARDLGLAASLAAAVALLPSALLQRRLGHDPRGTMSAGQLFHQGHRPESVGFGGSFPTLLKLVEAEAAAGPHLPDPAHQLYRDLARASAGVPLDDARTEAFWLRRGLAWPAEAPGAALAQQAAKAAFFLAPPAGESDVPEVLAALERVPGLPLRWLALLGAGGLLALLAAGWGGGRAGAAAARGASLPWVLQWLAALLVSQLFFPQGRYLVGLVPALAALAGLGAAALAAAGARPARTVGLALLAAAPAAVLLVPQVRWADRLAERVAAADALARRPLGEGDRWAAARERYLDAQAAMPDVFWPTSPRGAGLQAEDPGTARLAAERAAARWGQAGPVDATLAAGLWAAAGRCDLALPLARAAAAEGFAWALGDSLLEPRVVAADCLLAGGRRGEALAELEAATRARPGRLEVLARLVAAGDTGGATDVARWERQLLALHDGPSAHLALARARRRWGDPQGALADADRVAADWPAAAPFAALERALALAALGRGTEAAQAWAGTLGLHAPPHGLAALDGLAAAALAAGPEAAPLAFRHFALRGDRPRLRALVASHPELAAAAGEGDPPWRF